MAHWLRALAPVLVLALAAPAAAKDDKKTRREGDYAGVKPGDGAGKVRGQRARRPTLTWVGFEPREAGSSRIFVQLNRAAEHAQSLDEKGVLHVVVKGVRFGSRNARRRLETQFFDSRVAMVKSRRVRARRARGSRPAQVAGVRLDIYFKNSADAAEATASIEKEADGFHYLYLDFGPASERGDNDVKTGDDDVAP